MSDLRDPKANPPLSGELLLTALEKPVIREPFIESLVYKGTVLLLYADAGVGKSVISLCMALQASVGLPVFGFFIPTRPLRVYYCLTERTSDEPLERIQLMRKMINLTKENSTNLFIDEETVGINANSKADRDFTINRITHFCPNPDIVVFDPIYSMTDNGLVDPREATAFAKFSTLVQKTFSCANWLNGHTLKHTYEVIDGQRVEKGDPFMGSQVLKAHVTASLHMIQDKDRATFHRRKDSHSILLPSFTTTFDHESYISTIDSDKLTAATKAEVFFNHHKKNGLTFTFDDFFKAIQPATPRYTSKLLGVTVERDGLKNLSAKFSKGLYKF